MNVISCDSMWFLKISITDSKEFETKVLVDIWFGEVKFLSAFRTQDIDTIF